MSSVKRGSASNYDTLSVEDIAALPVIDVADGNSVLALWVPSSLLAEGLFVMKAWGFRQKQIYTWIKTSKKGGLAFGMGHHFRGTTEHALFGVRGRPKAKSRSERNAAMGLNLRHSQKPDDLQKSLERMYPGSTKLEMFARRDLSGWICIGLEAPSTRGQDIRDWSGWNRPTEVVNVAS